MGTELLYVFLLILINLAWKKTNKEEQIMK